jgi:glutathione S-transferase/RNA polymerase-associated protein
MIVYEHPFSPYAQKVKIALREKAVPFEARIPDGMGTGHAPALDRLNPRGEVPALVDGDETIFDSTIILEYLEDRFPTPALLPAAPADRARARMIEDICDTHYEAINWGLTEIRFFKRGDPALGEQLCARAAEQTAHMQTWLEQALGNRDWLVGDAFGWADIAALPPVLASTIFGLAPASGSRLASWYDRVRARPSVSQTIAEAMAALPFMENVAAYAASLPFRRAFRDHRLEWIVRSGGLQLLRDGMANDDIRFTETASFVDHHMIPVEMAPI